MIRTLWSSNKEVNKSYIHTDIIEVDGDVVIESSVTPFSLGQRFKAAASMLFKYDPKVTINYTLTDKEDLLKLNLAITGILKAN